MIHRVGERLQPVAEMPQPPEPLELDACYRYCEALARARHHNFPVASRFVPPTLRRHIWALYAFARTADDVADEPSFEGRRASELDRWEERLERCYFGEPADHPVFVALADTIRRFELPITEFAALISGFRTDLEGGRYHTFRELRSYTALAAEPIGHLFLYLGGYRDPALHRFADDLCTGLTLAKVLQDIPADLERGRMYLPLEDLRHFGVSEDDLAQRSASPAVGALVRFHVARARSLFERARPLVDLIGANLAIEMALIWHGGMRILGKLESAGVRLLERRPALNAADKAYVVGRALAWRGSSIAQRV
ncbi:squalene synthase HpnC [Haliangium ochraceum]|uniref:Squalene synthase HpnC n=1 Tax=Haliangium ochraceum (strain DSM 14365 / JCM 11303 / SMP-2) TaxID=502025 RepID=D0LV66_HALO1|nr:squalene synthase HpnC [Haliangium ochraceum]ACY15907.1 squalene synthase HpnC [Haliangium ochraceum DSM 14365]